MFIRQRTALPIVLYGLYLVALGLSFRCVSRALKPFVDRSHVAVWSWVQRLPGFRRFFRVRCRVSMFLLDENAVLVKGLPAWIWVAYEPISKRVLGFWLSWTRNSIQAELFLRSLVMAYGKHPVWTDGAPCYSEACRRLGLSHYRYRFGDRLFQAVERAVQMLKDRTENFDDYFPCRRRECILDHVWRWLNLFQLFNQPETINIIHNIKGVMIMA
ncbi:MAG: DDE-type integrase/transposase/recombinase [Nitrososphaerota archaeon]